MPCCHCSTSESRGVVTGTFVGLAAIAVGSGGIKPCVSAFIGDQFPPEKQSLLQGAFAIFYACINLG